MQSQLLGQLHGPPPAPVQSGAGVAALPRRGAPAGLRNERLRSGMVHPRKWESGTNASRLSVGSGAAATGPRPVRVRVR